jgi:hypothetical protein
VQLTQEFLKANSERLNLLFFDKQCDQLIPGAPL